MNPGETGYVTLTASPPHAPLILGDYPFTVTATCQADPSVSDDASATLKVTYMPILPDLPEGGLAVAVKPKSTTTTAGTTVMVNVDTYNNENFDDAITVKINLDGIPPAYRADLAWMSWTELTVFIPAGESITTPLEITIPSGTSAGYKAFNVVVTSTWGPVIASGYARTSELVKVQ